MRVVIVICFALIFLRLLHILWSGRREPRKPASTEPRKPASTEPKVSPLSFLPEHEELRRGAKVRLLAALRADASRRSLSVTVRTRVEMFYKGRECAGQYRCALRPRWGINGGFRFEREIFIHEDWRDDPWVLAHEMGHHVAITEYGDQSEAAAYVEARRLVMQYLHGRDREALEISFECRLKVEAAPQALPTVKPE